MALLTVEQLSVRKMTRLDAFAVSPVGGIEGGREGGRVRESGEMRKKEKESGTYIKSNTFTTTV